VQIGQFFQVSVPGAGEAPISISEYREGHLFMTIRRVGRVTDVIFNLKAGDNLFLRGSYGNGFLTESFLNRPVTVIAGGTGLAPVRGLIERLSVKQPESLELLVGFKSMGDRLFLETLENWEKRFKALVTLDKGEAGWSGMTGLVTTHMDQLSFEDKHERQYVVVGPPIMMKFVVMELLKRQVSEENIVVSFERNMSCGIGKCGHCKIDETYVCLEGPVFNYTKAKHLID
jgi:anaerobic sulfite reductase subunit B